MKTCPNPNCNFADIPDEAKYCPKCGSPFLKPFLYDGKGVASDQEGIFCVDIRQCKRVKGRGWTGKYEFEPGLPDGYTGFYALFDESEGIQILVDNGKMDSIFITDLDPTNQDDYTMHVWHYEEKETSKRVTYYAVLKNDIFISNEQDKDRSKIVLENERNKLSTVYYKEFQDFFGISFEKLMEHAEENTDGIEDCNEESIKEQPNQKSFSEILIEFIGNIISMAVVVGLLWLLFTKVF